MTADIHADHPIGTIIIKQGEIYIRNVDGWERRKLKPRETLIKRKLKEIL